MDKEQLRERIWRIADGVPLKLGRMTISTTDTNKLMVTGWTNIIHFENISKNSVAKELEDLKFLFSELSKSYNEEIESIISGNNLTIEYHMAYSDSGKAGIGLCSEINGELNWYIS